MREPTYYVLAEAARLVTESSASTRAGTAAGKLRTT